jgi:hypothetical protein
MSSTATEILMRPSLARQTATAPLFSAPQHRCSQRHSTAVLSATTPATVRQQLALLHPPTNAAGPRRHVNRKRGRGASVPLRPPQGVPAPGGQAKIDALVNNKRRALGHGCDGAPCATSTRRSAADSAACGRAPILGRLGGVQN